MLSISSQEGTNAVRKTVGINRPAAPLGGFRDGMAAELMAVLGLHSVRTRLITRHYDASLGIALLLAQLVACCRLYPGPISCMHAEILSQKEF